MKIEICGLDTKISDLDAQIIFVSQNVSGKLEIKSAGSDAHVALLAAAEKVGFSGKVGEIFDASIIVDGRVILVKFAGIGTGDVVDRDAVRMASGAAFKTVKACKKIQILIDSIGPDFFDSWGVSAVVEGMVMGAYSFDRYKSHAAPMESQVYLSTHDIRGMDAIKKMVKRGQVMGAATTMARDLANRSPNDLTPEAFGKWAKELFKKSIVDVTILKRGELDQLGMGAFLGVAQGASEHPILLVLRYHPVKNGKVFGFVGKGVTFDSGGISIKPGKGMSEMKADMSGAAAVLSAINALCTLNASINITGIIPLTENMPSGNALRPGDVIRAMDGTTIEVINTDAEGRLILADAITFAKQKENVSVIVDIATLTGACSVALGELAGAVIGNSPHLIESAIAAGRDTGERVWQLPSFDEFKDYLKSDVADIANMSEAGKGGTCTGAKFLEHFVGDIEWIHIDMASMMKPRHKNGYFTSGMSGFGARLLTELAMKQES